MSLQLRPPIFVIGNPRSGTTLLRLMLTCHRNIVIPPECGFAQWLKERFDPWTSDSLEAFRDAVCESRKFETWGVTPEMLMHSLESRAPATYAEAVSVVYECYGKAHDRAFTRWGDKNNYYLHHVPTLAALFPNGFFVDVVRDGRDVAGSYREVVKTGARSRFAPELPRDIETIAAEWNSNLMRIRASFRDLDASRRWELRFEDLVGEPETSLRRLCEAIGEEFDANMLEYHVLNKTLHLEPVEFLEWKSKTLERPEASRAGRWAEDLTPEDARRFERVARDMLVQYGYVEG